MSRSIAITLPDNLGTGAYNYLKAELEQAFHRANRKKVTLDENFLDEAVLTAISQAQKSAKERHNLKWEPENQRVLVLNRYDLTTFSDEEADTVVQQIEDISVDSAKISGKSLVNLLAVL